MNVHPLNISRMNTKKKAPILIPIVFRSDFLIINIFIKNLSIKIPPTNANTIITLQKPFINDEIISSFNSCVCPVNEFTH